MTAKTTVFSVILVLLCPLADFETGFAQSSELEVNLVIGIEEAPSIGEKAARITMVEFSDYQCPRSSEYFNWTMRQVVDEYVKTGKVRYIFRDFPLESIHPLALKAAEAARCAGEQGKYWEMHDRFFRNQASIEPEILPLHAVMLGLNIPKFRQCLDSGKYTEKVRGSVADGQKVGVRATPSFFLGQADSNKRDFHASTYIEGAQPYTVFKEAIEKMLSPEAKKPQEH